MDFSVVGGALVALVAAVPALTAYYQRQTRRQRRENRRLRAIVQEADVHMFTLERLGWTSRGQHPPPRPELLRVVSDDEDDAATPPLGSPAAGTA